MAAAAPMNENLPGKRGQTPLNCDSAEDDSVWQLRRQQRKTGNKTLLNRCVPLRAGGVGGSRAGAHNAPDE